MSWNETDKKALLVALEAHGPSNIEDLQKYLPDKSATEIRGMIQHYKQMAVNKVQLAQSNNGNTPPLNQWIQVLKCLQSNSHDIQDLYPRLFKYIALFEDHSEDAGVDLK